MEEKVYKINIETEEETEKETEKETEEEMEEETEEEIEKLWREIKDKLMEGNVKNKLKLILEILKKLENIELKERNKKLEEQLKLMELKLMELKLEMLKNNEIDP
jgi:hypothetical protein